MNSFAFITKELKKVKEMGLFRSLKVIESSGSPRVVIGGKELINFCSNDYLGLSGHQKVIERTIAILKSHGVGAGASRLVSGNTSIHEELELAIAKYKAKEAAIVFPTGYMANLGTIQALVGEGDAVILDRLDHASIVDGARLSGAKMLVYPHRDMEKLEQILIKAEKFEKRLIVTDLVFSMDGDVAPLPDLIKLAKKHKAMLMIDTAHSTGIVELRTEADVIIMGTLSKAIGSLGGFIAGSQDLIDYLRNKARTFIYTTGLPPAVAAASEAAIEIMSNDGLFKQMLWENVSYLRKGIKRLGFDMLGSETQIMPIIVGDPDKAVLISEYLFQSGIFLSAIRPPTVPKQTSRLRLTVTARHSREDMDYLLDKLKLVKEKYFA